MLNKNDMSALCVRQNQNSLMLVKNNEGSECFSDRNDEMKYFKSASLCVLYQHKNLFS